MAPASSSAAIEKISPEKTEVEKKKKKKEKPANEIEEIFRAAKGKRKRKELPPPPPSSSAARSDPGNKAKKKSMKNNINKEGKNSAAKPEGADLSSRKRRRTGDGLTIYSADELGFGNPDAGGTPLCPFDCSCCF